MTSKSIKNDWNEETLTKLIENGLKFHLEEEGLVHRFKCDVCLQDPIRGDRYKCLKCDAFDLCYRCFSARSIANDHRLDHPVVHLRFPNELFGRQVSENDLTMKNLSSFYANDVHQGITCRACQQKNFKGLRFKCDCCRNLSLCEKCLTKNSVIDKHQPNHSMILASDRVIMKITSTDVELGQKLGSGGFGAVYKARWLSKNRHVACKVINVDSIKPNDTNQQSFHRELKAYMELSGGYILKSFAYALTETLTGDACMLLMEYMNRGSLATVLEKDEKISFFQKLNMARQIASGMHKMHNHGMIHRDIRPDNILVNEFFTAKIGDMGIVRNLDEKKELTLVGCPQFMPPEFYTGDYDEKLDVYTYALTLNYLFTEVQHEFRLGHHRPIVFPKESPIFHDLIETSMEILPDDRPTSEQLETTMTLFTQAFYESIVKNTPSFFQLPTKEKDEIFMKFYQTFYPSADPYLKKRFPSIVFGAAAKKKRKINDEEPVECPIQ